MTIAENTAGSASGATQDWWRDAVIYQIYPRSFADANGDGMGDLPGIAEHLDHLVSLGIDALWLSPFYVSPQADAGYDVADYTDVDPLFGTIADFDALLRATHDRGLKLIVDLVPNHTSVRHAWFAAALASAPVSSERDWYIFRDGKGERGEEPPNNWQSAFGGPAWTRVVEADGTPGQWYLHLFDKGQPDLNWRNPAVVEAFKGILRFWLDRGVDGFRVDVAHGLVKAEGLPDAERPTEAEQAGPMWDQDDVHEIYRGWNAVLEECRPARILVAEAWVFVPERLARYVRHDEMQQAFNFEFLTAGWDALAVKRTVDQALATNAAVGATTTWVLSNHDVVRHPSRFGVPAAAAARHGIGPDDPQPDAVLGLQRGRAATLMMLALPGSAYVYQGEELGLPEHTTLPAAARADPTFFRTEGARVGRDGCRVPLPWVGGAPGFGFGPTGSTWLPQPAVFGELAADRQEGVPGSTLEFYRAAIALRRRLGLGDGSLAWNPSRDDVLDLQNGATRVVINYGDTAVPLPGHDEVLLASDDGAVIDGRLRGNAAVWLR